jgi:hypothetical protein
MPAGPVLCCSWLPAVYRGVQMTINGRLCCIRVPGCKPLHECWQSLLVGRLSAEAPGKPLGAGHVEAAAHLTACRPHSVGQLVMLLLRMKGSTGPKKGQDGAA